MTCNAVDEVFRALADPHRRALLDRLQGRDGQSLRDLCEGAEMTRFGVMKHLRVLESAGLVLVHRVGREKLHYLNPVPIRRLYERWVTKYTEPLAAALSALKHDLENPPMFDTKPTQIYEVFIRTTPERLWQALTDPAFTARYLFHTAVRSSFEAGAPIVYSFPDGSTAVDGEVIEADPPRKLVTTWVIRYDPSLAHERSRVTWRIEPRGETCKLTAIHELEGAPGTARNVGSDGWTVVLSGLKTLLETGETLVVAPAA